MPILIEHSHKHRSFPHLQSQTDWLKSFQATLSFTTLSSGCSSKAESLCLRSASVLRWNRLFTNETSLLIIFDSTSSKPSICSVTWASLQTTNVPASNTFCSTRRCLSLPQLIVAQWRLTYQALNLKMPKHQTSRTKKKTLHLRLIQDSRKKWKNSDNN